MEVSSPTFQHQICSKHFRPMSGFRPLGIPWFRAGKPRPTSQGSGPRVGSRVETEKSNLGFQGPRHRIQSSAPDLRSEMPNLEVLVSIHGVQVPNLGVPGTDVGIPAPDTGVQAPRLRDLSPGLGTRLGFPGVLIQSGGAGPRCPGAGPGLGRRRAGLLSRLLLALSHAQFQA